MQEFELDHKRSQMKELWLEMQKGDLIHQLIKNVLEKHY